MLTEDVLIKIAFNDLDICKHLCGTLLVALSYPSIITRISDCTLNLVSGMLRLIKKTLGHAGDLHGRERKHWHSSTVYCLSWKDYFWVEAPACSSKDYFNRNKNGKQFEGRNKKM